MSFQQAESKYTYIYHLLPESSYFYFWCSSLFPVFFSYYLLPFFVCFALFCFYQHSFFLYMFPLCCVCQMCCNSLCAMFALATCFARHYHRITRLLSVLCHQHLCCLWQCSLAGTSRHCAPDKITSFRRTARTICPYSLPVPWQSTPAVG